MCTSILEWLCIGETSEMEIAPEKWLIRMQQKAKVVPFYLSLL
jgi:hypothetical protein